MVKNIINWFNGNSVALQGVAALVLIISAIYGAWVFSSKFFSPTITVRTNVDQSTLPKDLEVFAEDVASLLYRKAPEILEFENNEQAIEVLQNPVVQKIRDSYFSMDKATIEITNNSKNTVTGVRLRIENVLNAWGVEIDGTFLDATEAEEFRKKIDDMNLGNTVVLPELPSLQPNSSVFVFVYGSLGVIKPTLTSNGHRHKQINVVEVDEGYLIRLYNEPSLILILLPLLSLVVILLFEVSQRVFKESKKKLLYDIGCKLAKDGYADEAIVLLNEAKKSGYSNTQHALQNEDLKSLQDRDDFKELFGELKK